VAREVLNDRISSTAAVSITTPRRYLNGSASPAPVTVGAARRIDRRTHRPHRVGVSASYVRSSRSVMATEWSRTCASDSTAAQHRDHLGSDAR
jgi:hypothetical protein